MIHYLLASGRLAVCTLQRGDETAVNNAKVFIDTTQVQEELANLTAQIESLSSTVEKLNESGLEIKLEIKVDSEKLLQKLFNK